MIVLSVLGAAFVFTAIVAYLLGSSTQRTGMLVATGFTVLGGFGCSVLFWADGPLPVHPYLWGWISMAVTALAGGATIGFAVRLVLPLDPG